MFVCPSALYLTLSTPDVSSFPPDTVTNTFDLYHTSSLSGPFVPFNIILGASGAILSIFTSFSSILDFLPLLSTVYAVTLLIPVYCYV